LQKKKMREGAVCKRAQPLVLPGAVACGRDKRREREENTHTTERERPAPLGGRSERSPGLDLDEQHGCSIDTPCCAPISDPCFV
jgi:hypothetical protein